MSSEELLLWDILPSLSVSYFDMEAEILEWVQYIELSGGKTKHLDYVTVMN